MIAATKEAKELLGELGSSTTLKWSDRRDKLKSLAVAFDQIMSASGSIRPKIAQSEAESALGLVQDILSERNKNIHVVAAILAVLRSAVLS